MSAHYGLGEACNQMASACRHIFNATRFCTKGNRTSAALHLRLAISRLQTAAEIVNGNIVYVERPRRGSVRGLAGACVEYVRWRVGAGR